jgi:hypothetical protein
MAMAFVVEAPEQWTKLIQLVETITAKDLSPTGQASATQNDGHVHYALRHLHQAQEGLEVAMRNKGGNCVKALQLLEGAIEELEQGTKRCPREPVSSASTSGGVVLRDELFEKWLSTGL